MQVDLYNVADDTLLAHSLASFQAGSPSDVITVRAWLDRGTPGAAHPKNGLLRVTTENPAIPGKGLAAGIAPQDEMWCEARFTGSSPGHTPFSTDWTPLGAYRALPFPDLLQDGYRDFEVRWRPPSSAKPSPFRFFIHVDLEAHSIALPGPPRDVERGVFTGLGDVGYGAILEGSQVAESSPADDTVQVSPSRMVAAGAYVGAISETVQLNQEDGASALLASGEAYWARISRDLSSLAAAAVVVTKGAKALAPDRPELPAGHKLLRDVLVRYQAGGTSVIEDTDLDGELLYDRLAVEHLGGLNVRIHPGQARAGGTWRLWSSAEDLTLAPSATSYLWQLENGLYTAVEGSELAPSKGALLLAEVDTDGTTVTAIRDRRTYLGRAVVLELSGATPGSPGLVASIPFVASERLEIERVIFVASDNGGGSAGSTKVDVLVDGTSIYPSSGTEDLRPSVAFDAAVLVDDGSLHETGTIRRGSSIELHTIEHPTGGSPASVTALLLCRY